MSTSGDTAGQPARMSSVSVLARRSGAITPDPICAAAVDTAWRAAIADGGAESVGGHRGTSANDERVVTHTFECTSAGYVGWLWHVTVVRAEHSHRVTVSEVVALPGTTALVAPQWIPWAWRLKPGDLTSGSVLPTDPADPRLAPGWSGDDDLAGPLDPGPLHPVCWEAGLGRSRVPSAAGRLEAASRWYAGRFGPASAMAKTTPGSCTSCGWMLTVGGPMGQQFGICTCVLSPADGSAVAFDYGCGAHSESTVASTCGGVADVAVDDLAPCGLEIQPT